MAVGPNVCNGWKADTRIGRLQGVIEDAGNLTIAIKAARSFGIGFLVGMAVPFLTAVFAMMINFDLGVRIGTVLQPFVSDLVDKIDDGLITLVNGLLYGTVACLISLLHSVWRSRRT